jgi:hypothetical protein
MPKAHSAMSLQILSKRTSLESSVSRAQRAMKPDRMTAKVVA